jgi:hypothetical protein
MRGQCRSVGPHARGRGGLTVTGERGSRLGSTTGGISRRFSVGSPVLRWGSGGEAWARVGGHGGGVNLTGGGLGWPVHGVVAGARVGEVAGEVTGRNR